jgi:hypothetical protein
MCQCCEIIRSLSSEVSGSCCSSTQSLRGGRPSSCCRPRPSFLALTSAESPIRHILARSLVSRARAPTTRSSPPQSRKPSRRVERWNAADGLRESQMLSAFLMTDLKPPRKDARPLPAGSERQRMLRVFLRLLLKSRCTKNMSCRR